MYNDILGFSCQLIEKELIKYQKKRVKIASKMCSINVAIENLKEMYIDRALENKGIKRGDYCVIELSGVKEKVQYCCKKNGYLYLYHFGINKKRYKHETPYPYYCADDIQLIKEK